MKEISVDIYKHIGEKGYSLTISGDDYTINTISNCYTRYPGNHTRVVFQGIELSDIEQISKCIYAAIQKEKEAK